MITKSTKQFNWICFIDLSAFSLDMSCDHLCFCILISVWFIYFIKSDQAYNTLRANILIGTGKNTGNQKFSGYGSYA